MIVIKNGNKSFSSGVSWSQINRKGPHHYKRILEFKSIHMYRYYQSAMFEHETYWTKDSYVVGFFIKALGRQDVVSW